MLINSYTMACPPVHGDGDIPQALASGLSYIQGPGGIAHSVMCLATDTCVTADPGVTSSTSTRSHTFVETDHEIISTVIILPSADSFKKVFVSYN